MFFFSSRRRHTRWTGDWSSDVCSSDLSRPVPVARRLHLEDCGVYVADETVVAGPGRAGFWAYPMNPLRNLKPASHADRSEERRVGKECRSRMSRFPEKENHKSEIISIT